MDISPEYIKAAYYEKYGVSIFIGIGIPIPILDVEIAKAVSIRNSQINTNICDYSKPDHPIVGTTDYESLFSGVITLDGKEIRTASLSSVYKARIIAEELKSWIKDGKFFLTNPVNLFPTETKLNKLERRD